MLWSKAAILAMSSPRRQNKRSLIKWKEDSKKRQEHWKLSELSKKLKIFIAKESTMQAYTINIIKYKLMMPYFIKEVGVTSKKRRRWWYISMSSSSIQSLQLSLTTKCAT